MGSQEEDDPLTKHQTVCIINRRQSQTCQIILQHKQQMVIKKDENGVYLLAEILTSIATIFTVQIITKIIQILLQFRTTYHPIFIHPNLSSICYTEFLKWNPIQNK